MNRLDLPWVRDVGAGPSVICLHSNAATSSQWRALIERLAPRHRVLAPDGLGAGRAPAWPGDRVVTLADEVDALAPVFAVADGPCVVVGHSYGAAVALKAALLHPDRIAALALYEPTLFALLDQELPDHEDARGIRAAVADAASAIVRHDHAAAGERFIDYWMGPGSWQRMPQARRDAIGAAMVHVAGWGAALFGEPTPLQAFRELDIPVLYMLGAQSPASSRGVARLLTQALPQVSVIEFPELGHMGPVTHAALVNDVIAPFVEVQGGAISAASR